MSVNDLMNRIQSYNPDADFGLLCSSYDYGQKRHSGQLRLSGEPYFETHCIEVAQTLIGLRLDTGTICAGLLHDVLEDTSVTREELASLFGETIAELVEGVTQIKKYPFKGGVQQWQAENYLKMLLATAEDIRVILIKLADRLHNMETLSFHSAGKRQKTAKETLEVYAPLAHRLGINRIKSRLEDLAFKHLEPAEYKAIARLLDEKLTEREEYKDKLVGIITGELEAAGIEAKVDGRPKHIYSIYQKISQKGVPFEQIRDLIGLRIWVNTTAECYAVIGILHSKWPHIPERLKDLIGLSKPNGYKSLHTTILDGGDGGRSVEIQVRTHEMHEVAEYGIAAHWSYKKGIPLSEEGQSIYVELRHMLKDIQGLNHPPHQFIQSMKQELFSDEVYVFSPKGDLYALAADATPVDFAYKIHTDIGHTCSSAEVNGELVPLRTCLRNGDRVKILTTPNGHPNRDWLRWVKTSTARNKIRHWFNEQDRSQALELGKRLLEDAMLKRRIGGGQAQDLPLQSPELLEVVEKLKLKTIEDLLRHIGNGKFAAPDIVRLLTLSPLFVGVSETEAEKQSTVSESMLSIPLFQSPFRQDIDVTMGRVMKCCNPIPGDEITVYLTRGRGISIHRAECMRLRDEPERMIHMEWTPVESITHLAEIVFECIDRPGMLFEITKAIVQCNVNIRDGNIGDASKVQNPDIDIYKAWENGIGYDRFTLEVTGVEQLSAVIAGIRQIKGVQRVNRKT